MTSIAWRISDHAVGWLNSYGQILFVNSRKLSILLMLATFLFPFAGISGIIAVVVGHIVADIMGFDRQAIRSGELGFNVLMTGLVLGSIYQFNLYLIFFLALAGLLSMLVTLWFRKVLFDHNLPYLSLPFLISVWVLLLSVSQYKTFTLSELGLFTYNDLALVGGVKLVEWYEHVQTISISPFWDVYFKSIGAIFFQYNLFAGIAIAVGLLLFSRISFVFSLVGFATGYFFYRMVDGNFTELHYSYIGFNFILTSIALGSFYLVPSFYALVVVVLVIPITAIFISALGSVFSVLQLPIYSLPFNIAVLMMIVVLRQRWQTTGPQLVWDQQFSPEKNLYTWVNRKERFKFLAYIPIHLPIVGEWRIPQGHDGSITHQGLYRYAWDFDIVDESIKSYAGGGFDLSDYYCYGKPVLAPADGEVVQVVDGLPDNRIGESDLTHNWGNTIVIKHAEGLYSKFSHLKAGKIDVKQGDRVSRGDRIAQVGSSGRSPEPHLHFQLQTSPYIGSATLWYPIAQYVVVNSKGEKALHVFDIPKENEIVKPVASHPLLRDAFKWEPGQILTFTHEIDSKTVSEVSWIVGVDMTNATYLYCEETKSTAWFHYTETMFHFLTFRGDTSSALYVFFIAAQKVLLSRLNGTVMHDEPDIQQCYRGLWLPVQDVLAPFFRFITARYKSSVHISEDTLSDASSATIDVATSLQFPWRTDSLFVGSIELGRDQADSAIIVSIQMQHKGKQITLNRL
jgi:urea transporter/murein DD-endopeptidase MepM/ murein hydrolase activator NlpD